MWNVNWSTHFGPCLHFAVAAFEHQDKKLQQLHTTPTVRVFFAWFVLLVLYGQCVCWNLICFWFVVFDLFVLCLFVLFSVFLVFYFVLCCVVLCCVVCFLRMFVYIFFASQFVLFSVGSCLTSLTVPGSGVILAPVCVYVWLQRLFLINSSYFFDILSAPDRLSLMRPFIANKN